MIDCIWIGEPGSLPDNRLCYHEKVHAGAPGVPERYCAKCPHREAILDGKQKTFHPCKKGPGGSPCSRIRLGHSFDAERGDCILCWQYAHNEDFNRAWGGGGRVHPVNGIVTSTLTGIVPKPCVFLRKQTGETIECPTCAGRVKVKLFGCSLHGKCSVEKPLPNTPCCRVCPDWREPDGQQRFPPVITRHLHFYIYPSSAGNGGVWRRTVGMLLRRMALFNGKRVVGVVTGPGLDPPEMVQAAFKGEIDDWIITDNNPRLREVKTFLPVLKKLKSTGPNEAIFFGHSKGTSKQVNAGVTSHPWGRLMYETCLDYWSYVNAMLQRYPIVGSFKKTFGPWGSSDWHYSGTFYWIRAAELFSRNWLKIDMTWWGSETYPGAQFRSEEAGCLFYEKPSWEMNLYDLSYWNGRIWPAYRKWRAERQGEETDWAALAETTARDRAKLKETASV